MGEEKKVPPKRINDAMREASQERRRDWSHRVDLLNISDADQKQLDKNRILVASETYLQMFSAYKENTHCPFFITSDSLLNAYHVLYEESIRRMELQLAAKGPEILGFMIENLEGLDKQLKGNPQLASAAKRRAQIVLGIALRLMDEDFCFKDRKLDRLIKEEVTRIERGNGNKGQPVTCNIIASDVARYSPGRRGLHRL